MKQGTAKKTIVRHKNIQWSRSTRLADIKCFLGIHNGWRKDIYVDTAKRFKYCPNCHEERYL